MTVKKYPRKKELLDGDLGLTWVAKWLLKRVPGVWALDPFTSNYYMIKEYKGQVYVVDEHPTNRTWGKVYSC